MEEEFSIWNRMGTEQFNLKNYESALKCFKEAVRLNPDYSGGYYNIYRALMIINDFKEALVYNDQVIQLNPNSNDSKIFYDRGNMLSYLQHYSDAIIYYNRVLEIDPKPYQCS